MVLSICSLILFYIALESGSFSVLDVTLQLGVFFVYCVVVYV